MISAADMIPTANMIPAANKYNGHIHVGIVNPSFIILQK
jgi:hypothetical protein